MTRGASAAVVRQIESLFDGGSVVGLTDRQLLERFTNTGDAIREAAFAALVRRHGPMVLGLCHELVGDRQLADYAFQAIFLILARKARSIRDPELLANWLYGVTRRTARKARVRLVRLRRREDGEPMTQRAHDSDLPPVESVMACEQAEALHDEIERLPDALRLPVVLCYFEGMTVEEAASQLKWPDGTVRSRLARARDKLRRGLTRRGVVLPVGVLLTGLTPGGASASIPPALCDTVARAALEFAAGRAAGAVSAPAMALAREAIRSMLVHKMRFLAMTVLILGAVATSAGYWNHSLAKQDEPVKSPPGQKLAIVAKPNDANEKPPRGRMFVVGRVLDPAGKPVPHAKVMVHSRVKHLGEAVGIAGLYPSVMGDGHADDSGKFRLDAPRTASARNDEFIAVALAAGYGIGWAELDPDADRPDVDIKLKPEQAIRGRLFDLQGRPAQGVTLSVFRVQRLLRDSENSDLRRRRLEGPLYWWTRVNDWPAWPKPATTDADGRFLIHGVGRGLEASLCVIDSRFALQRIDVATDNSPDAKSLTMALRPAQIITGRVICADTGKPVPRAQITVSAMNEGSNATQPTYFQTDADGRFRTNPAPGDRFSVRATPPSGLPYLYASDRFEWPKGAIEHSLDLSLPRGVLIRGKVTEEGSERPVAGASVTFLAYRGGGQSSREGARTTTLADGSFEVTGLPHPGHVIVRSPSEDYVLREIGNRELSEDQAGGMRLYSHAFIAINAKPAGTDTAVKISLRRGVTVKGRIVAADNQPVDDTWVISRISLGPTAATSVRWQPNYHGHARNGRFELHGLNQGGDVPVYFLEPKRKLGATVLLPGNSAIGEPITVRLQPCGNAKARLVDPGRQPVASFRAENWISMEVTPGVIGGSDNPEDAKRLVADRGVLTSIDPVNYLKPPASDAQGRIVFPALIPGASYYVSVPARARKPNLPREYRQFTVKPGETLDLGDIQIEKPRKE
jgi:RNA polymerase sigma factor (sigma-70 family)